MDTITHSAMVNIMHYISSEGRRILKRAEVFPLAGIAVCQSTRVKREDIPGHATVLGRLPLCAKVVLASSIATPRTSAVAKQPTRGGLDRSCAHTWRPRPFPRTATFKLETFLHD